jgi:hypothetical protein
VKIRRVEYDTNQILEIADANPDFPTFQQLDMRTAYRAMLTTGIHWREHLQKNTHEAHV